MYLRHSNEHTDPMICTSNLHTDGSVVDMSITICDELEDSRAHTFTKYNNRSFTFVLGTEMKYFIQHVIPIAYWTLIHVSMRHHLILVILVWMTLRTR